MLILGHTGITLGAATLLAVAINRRHSLQAARISWFTSLSSYIDIRVLLIGSLLPDIIDKPIGYYFFRETFGNGRIFGHTLLFLVLITAAGYILFRLRRKVWLLTLAAGTFVHLILDEMWHAPATLFWPFLGFTFARVDFTDWLSNLLQSLLSFPAVYLPELVGLAVLLWFGMVLIVRRQIGGFLRYGKIS
jgi:inner membrane protein